MKFIRHYRTIRDTCALRNKTVNEGKIPRKTHNCFCIFYSGKLHFTLSTNEFRDPKLPLVFLDSDEVADFTY